MQNIQEWLRSEVADVLSDRQQGSSKTDLERQAKLIWQAGFAAGYSEAEIKLACGGDMEAYLLNEVNGPLLERIGHRMERDEYSG